MPPPSRLRRRLLTTGVGLALASLALGTEVAAAQAGTVSTARIIALAATKAGRLTVTVTSGLVQSIPAVTDNTVNSFPGPAVIVTQWDLNPGQTNTVNLVAYFSLPAQAMSGGAVNIPSSRILGRMTTGLPVAFTAMTQNGVGGVGTAGGSLQLFSQDITGINKTASRTDNLDLQLNLVGFPTLPVGSYTGTLNIRAITQ
jgi:hypothetical protein